MIRAEKAAAVMLARLIRLELLALQVIITPGRLARLTPSSVRHIMVRPGGPIILGIGLTPPSARTADTAPAADEPMTDQEKSLPGRPDWCSAQVKVQVETGVERLICCLEPGHEGQHYDNAFLKVWSSDA